MHITNPANGEILAEIPEDTPESINEKFERLIKGQPNFARIPLKERVEMIKNLGEQLEKNLVNLSQTLTAETGKPIQESENEILGAKKKLQFFIRESEKYLSEQEIHTDGNTVEKINFDPLGVVLNISAWNYPYLVGINIFIPALICGNAVLYKPSEYATLTGIKIQELLYKSGIPESAFQIVTGGKETGTLLLKLPIQAVGFTGSYATGKKIAAFLAGRFVKQIMELGGKDPLYVTELCGDIKQTAQAVAEGCFYNNGQSCCAVERVYVHEKIYDAFIKEFLQCVSLLKVGDPTDKSMTQGAIARPEHIPILDAQVKDALDKGANLIAGGKRPALKGAFFEPTVFTNVNHSMKIMKEETFGPIRGIMRVRNDNEAIKLMNDTEYGLTASVYCQDHERARAILEQVQTGTSYINCCDRVSGYLPWSGRKNSGFGQALSYLGLYSFCQPRAIHQRTLVI